MTHLGLMTGLVFGVGGGLGLGIGVGDGEGVGVGVGEGEGEGVGVGVGETPGEGDGCGEGEGLGTGVGEGKPGGRRWADASISDTAMKRPTTRAQRVNREVIMFVGIYIRISDKDKSFELKFCDFFVTQFSVWP